MTPSKNLRFRLVRPDDSTEISRIYAPFVEDTYVSFEEVAPNPTVIEEHILELSGRYPWLVAEFEECVLGYAYASPHRNRACYRWSVDTSIYLDERIRGQGIGKQLYRTLLDIVERQGFYNAYGGITLPNPASLALHESRGFTRVGVYNKVGYKLGCWHSVQWLELSLRDHTTSVTEPIVLSELPDIDALLTGNRL